ncbi:dipeptidyl aminopeptidase 1-like [Pyrus x bretschneideri]|uniref:dipeptidyl aminopeptidase 1-like n=1 Tax=Pyrus x bretschneideri TaxID=225117 RepID=UPI00202F98CD|nr:dipeptidyl aminopeptidase 1-like [Pyrus x bretschneideri]
MLKFLNTNNTPLVARLSVDASLFDYEKAVLGYINTLQNCDKCQDKDCELYTKDAKYHCERCGYGFGFHFVNICGYGPGYWKVRNSWGCGWGVDGYFKVLKTLARNEKAPRALLGRKYPIFPYHPPHGVLNIEAGAIQPIGPIAIMRS